MYLSLNFASPSRWRRTRMMPSLIGIVILDSQVQMNLGLEKLLMMVF
jgi:hypothetical protein